jgi:hypothetical protein
MVMFTCNEGGMWREGGSGREAKLQEKTRRENKVAGSSYGASSISRNAGGVSKHRGGAGSLKRKPH